MSQGFGQPAFPVDTHIHRLAQRWGLTNGKNVVQTEKDLKDIFPKSFGINCIYKLSGMDVNIVRLETALELLVKSAKAVIQIEKSQLKPKKLSK